MHVDMVPKATCTCPLSRSGTKPPRYGTWTRLIPVIILNSHVELARISLSVGDELRDRLGWNGWIDHHDMRSGATSSGPSTSRRSEADPLSIFHKARECVPMTAVGQ